MIQNKARDAFTIIAEALRDPKGYSMESGRLLSLLKQIL